MFCSVMGVGRNWTHHRLNRDHVEAGHRHTLIVRTQVGPDESLNKWCKHFITNALTIDLEDESH